MSVIFNFIRALSGILYGYVSNISFLTSPTYYKLKNASPADENSVPTINPEIHLMWEVPATVSYTGRNLACLMLTHISSQTIPPTVS
jgi:hypothetical protein